jgi:hypothetical protein
VEKLIDEDNVLCLDGELVFKSDFIRASNHLLEIRLLTEGLTVSSHPKDYCRKYVAEG